MLSGYLLHHSTATILRFSTTSQQLFFASPSPLHHFTATILRFSTTPQQLFFAALIMIGAANSIALTGIVLEPLRKGNYENWSTLVRSYLVGQGLWDGIVTFGPPKRDGGEINDDEWTSKNAKALHAIQLACGSETLSSIRTFEDARDAWNHLSTSFSEDVSALPDFEEQRPEAEVECADSTWINELHSLVSKGKWNAAKAYIRRHREEAILSTRPPLGRTILHVAVASRRERIMEELISNINGPYPVFALNPSDIQRLVRMQDTEGYTALALAAELTDNKDVAEWMIHKGGNELLTIKTKDKGEIPILLAAAKGHKRMTRYFFSLTAIDDEFMSNYGRVLFTRCISAKIFDVAASLLQGREPLGNPLRYEYTDGQHPIMALAQMPSAFRSGAQLGRWNRFIYNSLRLPTHIVLYGNTIEIVVHDEPVDEDADTKTLANLCTTHLLGRIFRSMVSALVPVKRLCQRLGQFLTSVLGTLPGIEKIYEIKLNHFLVHGILERLSEEISKCNETDPHKCSAYGAMLLAAKCGNFELIESLRLPNPNLLWAMNDQKKGILAHAICHRQEKVFQFIRGIHGWQKEVLVSHIDLYGNNMLHLAAELGPFSYLNCMSNPALQMQRELQWFKGVETIVPPRYKEAKNNDGMTPHELFNKKHEDLTKAGEQWARDAASSFTLVGTLIVTIMFAAAFTIPGGNDQKTGMPIFLNRRAFQVFILADTISLITSSSSVLIFIEIIRFRYAVKDFLKCFRKILWGLFILVFSVISMMITFTAALSLMLIDYPGAIAAASSLAIIPILLLGKTLLSLFYEFLTSATWTPETK